MIDPSLRAERVIVDGKDPETAVIMCDCVIGYGSHPNPAEDLAEAIRTAKAEAEAAGRHLCCVCAVCGTEGDPQCLSKTQKQADGCRCGRAAVQRAGDALCGAHPRQPEVRRKRQ